MLLYTFSKQLLLKIYYVLKNLSGWWQYKTYTVWYQLNVESKKAKPVKTDSEMVVTTGRWVGK